MTGAAASPGDACADRADVLHATCVAFGAAGVLIVGPSGSGKSALALHLLALGAALVADDRVALHAGPPAASGAGTLVAAAPPGLPALIEARGIGLLHAPLAPAATVALAVDLGAAEPDRLPPRRLWHWRGIAVDCVHGPATGHFPAAIRQYIIHGRAA